MKAVTSRPKGDASSAPARGGEHWERLLLLSLAYGVGLLAYLLIEPTQVWLLALLAGLAALGADGLVRAYSRGHLRRLDATAVLVALPVLFAVGGAVFTKLVVEGYWAVPVAPAMALGLGIIVHAECQSLFPHASGYHRARLVLHGACFVTAFLFLAALYSGEIELGLWSQAAAVGMVSFLLAMEAFRDLAPRPLQTMALALAVGAVMGQTAWALHFLPLEANAGVVLLLLSFYLLTGVAQHVLAGQLGPAVVVEFAGVASLGMGAVIAAHRFL